VTDLRWGSPSDAGGAAARFGLADARFRGGDGGWWRLAEGTWETYDGGGWRAARPPDRLEGAADIVAAPRRSTVERAESGGPRDSSFPKFIERSVVDVSGAYRAGQISSGAAEALLLGLYAVDRDGGVWTVGARTMTWHRFRGGRWSAESEPPQPAELVDASAAAKGEVPDAVMSALAAFLGAGDLIPETVAVAWDPPAETAVQVAWRATHRVPPSGLSVWETPNAAAQPFGSLAAGFEVELVERAGAWARVTRPGGWSGWVDGRLLSSIQ